MLHRIRAALNIGGFDKMGGPIAARLKWTRHSSVLRCTSCTPTRNGDSPRPPRLDNKIAVMGLLDRELRQVRTKIVPNVKRETLQNEILNQVNTATHVYTDSAAGYDNLRDVSCMR